MAMVGLFRSGLSLRRVGLAYGLTRQRVQQIVRAALGPDYRRVLLERYERGLVRRADRPRKPPSPGTALDAREA